MTEGKAKMRRGILFLIEEVRRLVVNDADANEVLEILEELEASTKTRLRSCACGEPIDTDYEAVLWHDHDDLYHLDTNLSKHLPSLLPRQKVKVHVIILPEPQGE